MEKYLHIIRVSDRLIFSTPIPESFGYHSGIFGYLPPEIQVHSGIYWYWVLIRVSGIAPISRGIPESLNSTCHIHLETNG